MNREELVEFLKSKIKELESEKDNINIKLKKLCDNCIDYSSINNIEILYDEVQILDYIKKCLENVVLNEYFEKIIINEVELKEHLGGVIDTNLLVTDSYVRKVKSVVRNKDKFNSGYLKESSLKIKCINKLDKYLLNLMKEI